MAALFALAAPVAQAAERVVDGGAFLVRFDDADLGPYGVPFLSGDTLVWSVADGQGFAARSVRGADHLRAGLTFQIELKPGFVLEGLRLEEAGQWQADGAATAAVLGRLVLGGGDDASEREWQSFTQRVGMSGSTGTTPSPWSGGLAFAFDGQATPVDVTLQNLLSARALPPRGPRDESYAFVNLSEIRLHFQVSAVPEGSTAAMLLAGLGLLGWRLRHGRR